MGAGHDGGFLPVIVTGFCYWKDPQRRTESVLNPPQAQVSLPPLWLR